MLSKSAIIWTYLLFPVFMYIASHVLDCIASLSIVVISRKYQMIDNTEEA